MLSKNPSILNGVNVIANENSVLGAHQLYPECRFCHDFSAVPLLSGPFLLSPVIICVSILVSAAGRKVQEGHTTIMFLCMTQNTDPTEFSTMLFENQR